MSKKLEKEAIKQVSKVIQVTSWNISKIIILIYEEDSFWTNLKNDLSARIYPVSIIKLYSNRGVYKKFETIKNLDVDKETLLIIQDPVKTYVAEPICNEVRRITDRGAKIIFIEFPPSRLLPETNLRKIYLEALSYPVNNLFKSYDELKKYLNSKKLIRIRKGTSSIYFKVDKVFDDFSSVRHGRQIIQMPLGEVWVIPKSIEGNMKFFSGINLKKFYIKGSSLYCSESLLGEIVEVGFGVNPWARDLPTVLSEKRKGNIHFGFGDSELIGGAQIADTHFDFVLPKGFILD